MIIGLNTAAETVKKNKKINENDDNKEEKSENEEINENENNDEESESKSLSSDDNEVQNAKQILGDDDEEEKNLAKIKRKNIEDYKKQINILRKKVKREKEKQYDEEELKKKVEEEKMSKMNILQKYNYNYIKTNQANKLTSDERLNKLKQFKSFIGGGDPSGWYKNKLKFQTDSQKAFTLDMINKEMEKNEKNE